MSGKRGNGEGSISFNTSKGLWTAAISFTDPTTGAKKRKFIYGSTREQVASKLVTALSDRQDRGIQPTTDRRTVEGFVSEWLEKTVKPTLARHSYQQYCLLAKNQIYPNVGTVQLTRLAPEHVQDMQADLTRRGLSPATIKQVRNVLSGALTQAMKWGVIPRNVVALVDAPRQEHKEKAVLTPDEVKTVLAASLTQTPDLHYLFVVLVNTGLRISEACGLCWDDVDLDNYVVHVRRQLDMDNRETWTLADLKSTSGERIIPLIPDAVDALRKQKATMRAAKMRCRIPWPADDFCFANEIGQPLHGTSVSRALQKLVARLGIDKNITSHNLRHSAATHLLASDVDLRTVQAIMGHSDISMTAHYLHVMPSMLNEARDKLAAYRASAAAM